MNTRQSVDIWTQDNATEVPKEFPQSNPLYDIAVSLWTFYYPAILLLGTFGNVMSIVIMHRMMSKESTVNIFFIAIAVGDLMVLCAGALHQWVDFTFGLNLTDNWPSVFYPAIYVYLSSGCFVSWMLVCMTLQRALSVVWPHHIHRICTRRRVVVLIVIILVFQMSVYSHIFYCVYATSSTNITGSQCISMESSSDYAWFLDNVFAYIELVDYSLLPFICLVVGNSILVSALASSHRVPGSNDATAVVNVQRKRDTISVTLTIVVVSMAFIVLTLPSFVHAILYRFKDQTALSPQDRAQVFLAYTTTFQMGDTNSAINFYLYCLTGRRFRKEFVKVLSCGKPSRFNGVFSRFQDESAVSQSNRGSGVHNEHRSISTVLAIH